MPVVSQQRSKESLITDQSPLVLVYNRTPTKIGGVYKYLGIDGKMTELAPGGSAEVPRVIAENWNKVSNGLVTLAAPSAEANPHAELAAERRKTADLEAKLAAFEARIAAMDAKASKAKG